MTDYIDIASGLRIAASDARVAATVAEARGDMTAAQMARDLADKFENTVNRYEAKYEVTA